MNLHLTMFHIYPFFDRAFIDSFLSNHFSPNNLKKARTKLPNKFENVCGRKKLNGPITSTFVPIIKLTNAS